MNCLRSSAVWLLLFALPYCVGCGQSVSPAATPTVVASAAPPKVTAAAAPANSPTSEVQPIVAAADAEAANTSATAAASAKPASSGEKLPVREITFDNIKLAMNKDEKFQRSFITPAIEKLSGTPVRIRGWIHPNSVFQQTGITQFVLVRDNQECCFGPGAAIFDCIMVEMTPGNTTDFTTRPIAVEGTFSVREVTAPWGTLVAIYHLDADGAK